MSHRKGLTDDREVWKRATDVAVDELCVLCNRMQAVEPAARASGARLSQGATTQTHVSRRLARISLRCAWNESSASG